MTKRIGFACKFIPHDVDDPKNLKEILETHNTKSTTIKHLNTLSESKQLDKIIDLLKHNAQAIQNIFNQVITWPEPLRMVRLSSDIGVAYTHENYEQIYLSKQIQDLGLSLFSKLGDFARANNIRLSFHPGQYTVLNSVKPRVVESSIKEIEYHTDIARWLGYCDQTFHPHNFAINIHVGGKQGGIEAFLENSKYLSQDSRNLLTVENDEISFGIDDTLKMAEYFALVLDIHHHWCYTEGEYIQADDPRIATIIKSWRGQKPKIHLSISREDVLIDHPIDSLPDYQSLANMGLKKKDLRKHSEFCWNTAVGKWAISHWNWADIMVEAKQKNLASRQLYEMSI